MAFLVGRWLFALCVRVINNRSRAQQIPAVPKHPSKRVGVRDISCFEVSRGIRDIHNQVVERLHGGAGGVCVQVDDNEGTFQLDPWDIELGNHIEDRLPGTELKLHKLSFPSRWLAAVHLGDLVGPNSHPFEETLGENVSIVVRGVSLTWIILDIEASCELAEARVLAIVCRPASVRHGVEGSLKQRALPDARQFARDKVEIERIAIVRHAQVRRVDCSADQRGHLFKRRATFEVRKRDAVDLLCRRIDLATWVDAPGERLDMLAGVEIIQITAVFDDTVGWVVYTRGLNVKECDSPAHSRSPS